MGVGPSRAPKTTTSVDTVVWKGDGEEVEMSRVYVFFKLMSGLECGLGKAGLLKALQARTNLLIDLLQKASLW